MALTYMRIYSEQMQELEALPDAIYKEMVQALMRYAFEDVEPAYQPGTMEHFAWTAVKRFVERDKGIHDQKVAAGSKPKQTEAEASTPEQTEAEGSRPEQTEAEGSRMEQNEFCSDHPAFKIKNKNKNKNKNKSNNLEEDDDAAGARAREAADAWQRYFGETPAPGVLDRIGEAAERCGFEEGIVDEAVHSACIRQADSPVDYILTLFADWRRQKITTLADLDAYQALRDRAKTDFAAQEALRTYAQRAGPD